MSYFNMYDLTNIAHTTTTSAVIPDQVGREATAQLCKRFQNVQFTAHSTTHCIYKPGKTSEFTKEA